jgi:hypothetical protein
MTPARWPRAALLLAATLAIARVAVALASLGSAAVDLTYSSGPSELGLVTVLVHVAFVAFAPVFALAGCFGVAIQRRL